MPEQTRHTATKFLHSAYAAETEYTGLIVRLFQQYILWKNTNFVVIKTIHLIGK
ncbi:hypothetical protein IQ238_28490 [Pleurocapsales cyanobacterium LEGE 06147]|nr:hypothetical protein [Pleurocapsales cyanobacterium LEGE 06147]